MTKLDRMRALRRGGVSHRAMVTSLAGGVNPRGVLWCRKITPSAEPAVTPQG